MNQTPASQHEPVNIWKSRYGWTIIAFILAGVFIGGLVIWQLWETSPRVWCSIVTEQTDGVRTACLNVLLKLLDLKDHAIVGLLVILGVTVVSVVAVALGVRISAQGPGGTSVDVGREKTTVDTDNASVEISTPSTRRE